jgi:rubrerythrin
MPEKMTRSDVYRLAIEMEESSYGYYNELADTTEDRGVRNEILYLRDEEEKHRDFFRGLQKKAGGSGEAGGIDPGLIESEVIRPMQQARDEGTVSNRSAALRLGVRFEEITIRFYEAIRAAETDPGVLKSLDAVLEEERRHRQKLNVILAY